MLLEAASCDLVSAHKVEQVTLSFPVFQTLQRDYQSPSLVSVGLCCHPVMLRWSQLDSSGQIPTQSKQCFQWLAEFLIEMGNSNTWFNFWGPTGGISSKRPSYPVTENWKSIIWRCNQMFLSFLDTDYFYKHKRTSVISRFEKVTRPGTDRLSLNAASYFVKCLLNAR